MMNRSDLNYVKDLFDEVDSTVFGTKSFKDSVALLYHENSKFDSYSSRRQGEDVQGFNNDYFHKRASQPYKMYAQKEQISLNEYKNEEDNALLNTIKKRRSIRDFDNEYNLTLNELYLLCNYSYGITFKSPIHGLPKGSWGYRSVPSGGALFPLEIYIVLFRNNEDINNGLYHYRPDINGLEHLKKGSFYEELNPFLSAEPYVNLKNASGVVFITSVFERMMVKYKERGYRFVLMETGFVSQNFSLVCEYLNLGSCMVGGYLDDKVNNFLGLDGYTETVQNVIVFGKKKEGKESANNENYNL